jgi:hypothetical protein
MSKITNFKLRITNGAAGLVVACTLLFAYLGGPLPGSKNPKLDAFLYTRPGETAFAAKWAGKLKDDSIKVSSTDQIAPFLTSRRYFYIFSENYKYADYVIISQGNLQYTYRKDEELPAYESIKKDPDFEKIEEDGGYLVYKKLVSSR